MITLHKFFLFTGNPVFLSYANTDISVIHCREKTGEFELVRKNEFEKTYRFISTVSIIPYRIKILSKRN